MAPFLRTQARAGVTGGGWTITDRGNAMAGKVVRIVVKRVVRTVELARPAGGRAEPSPTLPARQPAPTTCTWQVEQGRPVLLLARRAG